MTARTVSSLVVPPAAAIVLATGGAAAAPPTDPIVRAVFFWSKGCPACHVVIEQVFPRLEREHGDRLYIRRFEMSDPSAVALYQATAQTFRLRPDQYVVPLMVIGDQVLIGWGEIRDRLPDLIATHLARGGLAWPAIPGLAGLIGPEDTPPAAAPPRAPVERVDPAMPTVAPAPEGPRHDPVGLGLAIAVMAGMIVALLYVAYAMLGRGARQPQASTRLPWVIPVLSVAGLIVAGYLTYIESLGVPAVCGPIGDCNAVQASPYAKLFGIVPVALLGVAGYLGILTAWVAGVRRRRPVWPHTTTVAFSIALLGTVLSLYLTYLEPFVIQAVCA